MRRGIYSQDRNTVICTAAAVGNDDLVIYHVPVKRERTEWRIYKFKFAFFQKYLKRLQFVTDL